MNVSKLKTIAVVGLALIASGASTFADSVIEQQKNAQGQFRKQAEALVARMSLEEKASVYSMISPRIKRFGIPEHDWWNEALHGVARNGEATQFPQSIAMASTWDPELIEKMATAIGDEARAIHHSQPGRTKRYQGLTIWSPTINLARDPRWGRSEETYGEDPYLTSRMAIAFVRGLQGNDPKYYKAIATIKHFIANNSEFNRYDSAPPISERDLREYYLVPYQAAVEEANVQSLMTAYNGVNGIPATVDKRLLTDVLRGEWGFSGSVVTDARAPIFVQGKHKYTKSHAETVALMIKAGVNVSSQKAPEKWTEGNCIQAVKQGLVTEAELDQVVIQNLTTRMQLGQIVDDADNPYKKIPMSVVGTKEHLAIAREIAQKGIVLLQNNSNRDAAPLLPLDRETVKKIIVAGPYARSVELGGYSGTPTHTPTTPLQGIQNHADDIDVELLTWGGSNNDSVVIPSMNLRVSMDPDAVQGLKAEYFSGVKLVGKPETVRVDNKIDFDWPKPLSNVDPDIPQPEFSTRWSGALVPEVTGEYILQTRGDDGMRVWLDGKKIIDDWRNGSVRTKSSKSIRLTAGKRYPLRVEYYDFAGQAEAHLNWIAPQDKAGAGLAADTDSTVVVYLAGFDLQMANEGKDLNDLSLPDDQKQELEWFMSHYDNVVVVLFGGNIITEPWLFEHVPAVLHGWYAGQEGGDALADLLFGEVSPSGKLPQTWFRSTDDLPALDDYAIHTGRTYQYLDIPVQFPFGHGLSYTTFEYGAVAVSENELQPDDVLKLRIPVKNTGRMAAEEVVQVYVANVNSSVYQPKQKLVSFGRVAVAPGQTEMLDLEVPVERFAHWDDAGQRFVVEPGEFELRIGASSADIRQTATIVVK